MLDTLTAKCKSDKLACKILSSKPALVNTITKKCEEKFKADYYKSHENKLRSLNVYYSYNVMGKRKYLGIRRANKAPRIPNFVINSIDIGYVSNINPTLTNNLDEDEIGSGMFRDLVQFAQRLAEFYLKIKQIELTRSERLTSIQENVQHPLYSSWLLVVMKPQLQALLFYCLF